MSPKFHGNISNSSVWTKGGGDCGGVRPAGETARDGCQARDHSMGLLQLTFCGPLCNNITRKSITRHGEIFHPFLWWYIQSKLFPKPNQVTLNTAFSQHKIKKMKFKET